MGEDSRNEAEAVTEPLRHQSGELLWLHPDGEKVYRFDLDEECPDEVAAWIAAKLATAPPITPDQWRRTCQLLGFLPD
jgi:hypothetical protein